jgi:lipase chaperone LimK
MCYEDRLREYEREKRKLMNSGMSAEEYERAIIALARKWRI